MLRKIYDFFSFQIIRELREEVEMLKKLLAARIAGPGGTGDIEEKLSESEKLMRECTMSWEQKEKQTEKIQQVKLRKACRSGSPSWLHSRTWTSAFLGRPIVDQPITDYLAIVARRLECQSTLTDSRIFTDTSDDF